MGAAALGVTEKEDEEQRKVFQSCGYATLSQRKRHTNTE
jgi:hypothetical protein